MPFTIHWADHCNGPETLETLPLPVGTLLITRQAGVITDIAWDQQPFNPNATAAPSHPWLDPQAIVTVTLLKQGTAYRQQVWAELCKIPYGTTLTYAALAKNISSAARAVGNACRDNPYPLVIPCHRVVSASGMGGYNGQIAGDFMAIKARLLAFEAERHPPKF